MDAAPHRVGLGLLLEHRPMLKKKQKNIAIYRSVAAPSKISQENARFTILHFDLVVACKLIQNEQKRMGNLTAMSICNPNHLILKVTG